MNKEIRHLLCDYEIRTEDGQAPWLEGYALKFESWSESFGEWREIISRTALDKCDLSDVRALVNHNPDLILARNSAGNLHLEVDNIGLRFKMQPANTSYYRDLVENMRVGNVNQCSFAFCLNYNNKECEQWTRNDTLGIYERRLNDISIVSEISILATPAYKATEAVVCRSFDDFKDELQKQKDRELLKQKLQIELQL